MDENRIKEYTLENGMTFTAYIPQNVSSDTPVFYYSYVVGSDYETDTVWQGMEEDMARYDGNAIVIIPHDKQLVIGGSNPSTHKYQTNAVNAFNLVKEDLNLETNQFINGGFSAGFGYGTRTLAHYLQENPDAERQVLFAVDGVINPTANLQGSELQALKDNNTLIISFTQQKNHNYQANLFKDTGLPILYVVDNSIPEYTPDSQYWGIHDQVAKDFYNKGLYSMLIDFALGKGEMNLPEGYSLRYYDPETGKIRQITKEEAASLMNISTATQTTISAQRLSLLASLADIKIASDDDMLGVYLNSIRNSIRNTSFLQGNFSASSLSSTTKVPSAIPDLVNQFFASNVTLLETIATDTEEFAKIGASIKELDTETALEAEQITETIDISTEAAVIGTTAAVVTQTQNQTTSQNTSTTTANKPENNSSTTSNTNATQKPTENQTSDKNTSSSNTSTSNPNKNQSTNQTSSTTTTNKTEQSSTTTTEEFDITKEFYDYDTLYSDDTKIVFNYKDEYKIIVHKDGDKITGIEYYYDYKTESAAKSAIETLTKEYSSVDHFDQVLQKDQYIKVLFKEDMFKDLTISNIKEKLSFLENLEEIIKK